MSQGKKSRGAHSERIKKLIKKKKAKKGEEKVVVEKKEFINTPSYSSHSLKNDLISKKSD